MKYVRWKWQTSGVSEDPAAKPTVYSIGHSNHTIEKLVSLLDKHQIEVVADVRTAPFSRYSPQFNRDALSQELTKSEIGYVFLGRELGGRPDGDHYYDAEGHVRYDHLSKSDLFEAGLERLIAGAQDHRVSMLCSEGDPSQCHRHLLIARVLKERGCEVIHIQTTGGTITYSEVAEKTYVQTSLFDEEEEESLWRSPLSVLQNTVQNHSSQD